MSFVEKVQYSCLSNDSEEHIVDNIASWATLHEVEASDSDTEIDELPEEQPPLARKQLPNSDRFQAKRTSRTSDPLISHNGELYINANISPTLPTSSASHPNVEIEHEDKNQTSSLPFQVSVSMPATSQKDITIKSHSATMAQIPVVSKSSATGVETPSHGLVDALNSAFEQNVPPKMKQIKQRKLTSQAVSHQIQDVPLEHADHNGNVSSDTAITQASSATTRLRTNNWRRNSREYKLEDFAGANVNFVSFSKKPNVGSDVIRLNLRHLSERKTMGASIVGENEIVSFATSTTTRKQQVAEILEKTFNTRNQGQNLDRKPQSARRNTSRETSSESQASMGTLDFKEFGLGSKRKLGELIESISSKRPRSCAATAVNNQDTVGNDLIRVWNFKINQLIKGKIHLAKADLQDLKDMLERISALVRRVDVKNVEAQKLRESLTRLSVLQDIPFDDENGLRQQALGLVKAWGAS
ncbi:hypothetical protein C0989_003152 [Termitomyces sp. Mn162]|nr:hypothetical protein C0989_003152 [Termitomyces sp. Mn162]